MKVLNGISAVSLQSTRYLTDSLKKYGVDSRIVVYRKNKVLTGFEDASLNINFDNKLLFPFYSFKVLFFFIKSLFKFQVFHFHFGHTLLPWHIDLRLLKFLGKRIFMEYHGSDIRRRSRCSHPDLIEYCISDKASFKKQKKVSKFIDGFIVHDNELKNNLFELNVPIHIVPLRLNLNEFTPAYPVNHKKEIVIVHSPTKTKIKGTEYILDAISKLEHKYLIDFRLLTNIPNSQVKRNFIEADIIIDQLIIGEYGMVSIEAMALGKPVICFLDNSYFDQICILPPILNANERDIAEKIEHLINNFDERYELGVKGRKFVEGYHDSDKVAKKMKKIYENEKR